MVAVMVDLQKRRQLSAVFAGKDGFITPRDLLRWGNRSPGSNKELAETGCVERHPARRTES
jgi:midasin